MDREWAAWIGSSDHRVDVVTASPVARLAATLDRAEPPPRDGDPLPPLWHWLYFLPQDRESEIGRDGHARHAPPARAPVDAAWSREIHPDPLLLFRYSALTFNGHRIHYDRSYATGIEHYPGLVVHGPLIATLLVDLLRRALPHAQLAAFAFRATHPLFDGEPFFVRGKPAHEGATVRLWAESVHEALAMDATATLTS